jgi:hypothetical protein
MSASASSQADAGRDAGGWFSCRGGNPCNQATSFCYIMSYPGQTTGSCEPIPAACTSNVTCACIENGSSYSGLACTDSNGQITIEVDQ